MCIRDSRNAERDINWIIGGQLTYNKNYVSKLSEAIKAQNEAYLKEDVDVANLFYEGRPQKDVYKRQDIPLVYRSAF